MEINVSAIVPAFNEEKSIGQTIGEMGRIMKQGNFDYEIIVVDDGSTDDTGKIALEKGAKLIVHEFNHGYGASIKAGVAQAKYDIILIIDADATYPVEEVPNILRHMDRFDMVVGARVGNKVEVSLPRKLMKYMLTKLANYLSASKIVDLNSGLRAIKKDLFYKFIRIMPDGFSLTTTVTLALLTNNYRVKYIPINYRRRVGRSKFRPLRDTLGFLQLIFRTSLLFNPLKIFIPLSVIMFLSSLFVFFYSLFFLPYRLDITAVILFVGGIQVLAVGMLADLIDRRMN